MWAVNIPIIVNPNGSISNQRGSFMIKASPKVARIVGTGERPNNNPALMFGPSIKPIKGMMKMLIPVRICPILCCQVGFKIG